MIAFYCIKLNILKSYAILSCFRITKMENDPISIIHDNPFFLFLSPKCVGRNFDDFPVFHE